MFKTKNKPREIDESQCPIPNGIACITLFLYQNIEEKQYMVN